jgi:hypothetical protein
MPDGSLETIMVANPVYLEHVKVGARVGLARAQAKAITLEKSGVLAKRLALRGRRDWL